MKRKKLETIENKDTVYNFWYIGKDIATNMTNGYPKQNYHILERQLKIIRRRFQVETYKRGG